MRTKQILAAATAALGLVAIGLGPLARSQEKPAAESPAAGCPHCKKDAKDANCSGDEKEEPAKTETARPNGKVREIHLYTVDKEWKFADGKSTYVMGYANWDDDFSKAPEPIDKKRLSERLTVPSPTI